MSSSVDLIYYDKIRQTDTVRVRSGFTGIKSWKLRPGNVLEAIVNILNTFSDIATTCQSKTAETIEIVVQSIVYIIDHLKQAKKPSLLKKR